MISLMNSGVMRCAHDCPKIWDKAAYISQYTAWADLALGVILCVIGGLASHGIIPMAGSAWMIAAGTLQLVILVALKCTPCCKTAYRACRNGGFEQASNLFSRNPAI
jgi:hypothetical protein